MEDKTKLSHVDYTVEIEKAKKHPPYIDITVAKCVKAEKLSFLDLIKQRQNKSK